MIMIHSMVKCISFHQNFVQTVEKEGFEKEKASERSTAVSQNEPGEAESKRKQVSPTEQVPTKRKRKEFEKKVELKAQEEKKKARAQALMKVKRETGAK